MSKAKYLIMNDTGGFFKKRYKGTTPDATKAHLYTKKQVADILERDSRGPLTVFKEVKRYRFKRDFVRS